MKKALIKFWVRFTSETPKWFKWMKLQALAVIPVLSVIMATAPDFDFALITLYKGTGHEKILWFTQFLAIVSATMSYVGGQVVTNYDTYQNKVNNKLNRTDEHI